MNELIFFILHLFVQPNRQDVVDFLARDETNLIPYSETFDCKDFTETLMNNAIGFDTYQVGVAWGDGEGLVFHTFVAFETSDGIVWVEPQNDRFYIVSEESLCYTDGECVTENLRFVLSYE